MRDLEEFRNKIKISTYDLTVNFWGWPIPINYDLKNKLSKASFYLSLVIQNGITPITPRILEKKEYLKGMIDSYIKLLLDIKEPLKIVKEYAETMDETKAQPQMTYMLLLEYKKLFQKADPEVSSSIDMDNPGGIAFNALPIQIESVASSVLGAFPRLTLLKAIWTLNGRRFSKSLTPGSGRRPSD